MRNAKWRYVAFGLLVTLLVGNYAYAAERTSFWSDIVPTPSCYETRDRGTSEIGLSIDGKTDGKDVALPTCKEAKKNFVLVQVDGKYLHTVFGTRAEPFIENGRTMIPLRALADAFGFEVEWVQKQQKITLKKDNVSIIMNIGRSEMLINGKAETFEDAVPMIKNNVTFLPVRQLAEILGVEVNWDNTTRTATFVNNQSS